MNKKVLLMILDGWGTSPDPNVSAIAQAKTPYIDALQKNYPNANLKTYGMHVGLPDGQMGNSEVGHMNLGAGRIVYQDFAKINKAIQEDTLKDQKVLQDAIAYAKKANKKIHLLGLLSDGGVHAHIDHLKALVQIIDQAGVKESYIHGFTDGRDVDPKSAKAYVQDLEKHLKDTHSNTQLASLIGRYYAMDRDNRWERVAKAYHLLVHGTGEKTTDFTNNITKSYDNGITDEFLEPMVKTNAQEKPIGSISAEDVVLFFNFRTDRGRELTKALHQEDFIAHNMQKLPLHFVTMTKYDDSFKGIGVIYEKENLKNTLAEVLAGAGKTQVRIAETEKYPHVTFFFNGGRETPFAKEERILCPSPKVATYDLQPQMSAYDITDAITKNIQESSPDFICLNFANPDMVGHTGSMDAAIKACEVVDTCAQRVIDTALEKQYSILVIADHGNCDTMINPDGSPNTAHTTNLVPLILVDKDIKTIKDGVLSDIAPTILTLMGVEKPIEMTQNTLI